MDLSLNVTSMVLFVSSIFIIGGSSIWIFVNNIGPSNSIAVASTNLVSLFGISVGVILTQIDLNKKNKELYMYRNNDKTSNYLHNIELPEI